MKAIEILDCLCYMGESSEQFNIVTIPEENTKEFLVNLFGKDFMNHVDCPVYFDSGCKYFYYWTTESLGVLENRVGGFLPTGYILTGDYHSSGVPAAINFYRIDD